MVDWIAYGHTVQTAKDKSAFGSGDVRGVIGPESSNNAKEGGWLVPTLLFGIPGSGSMAIFISAVALLGTGSIEVGPSMLKNNLDFTYAIVWLLALATWVDEASTCWRAWARLATARLRLSFVLAWTPC